MSKFCENETKDQAETEIDNDNTYLLSDMTDFEQLYDWFRAHKKFVIACFIGLIHTVIYFGIIFSIFNRGDTTENAINEACPLSVSVIIEPIQEPVKESSILQTDESTIKSVDDSSYVTAYEAGMSAGEILIESIDALIDFWNGFDEATGASDWVRDRFADGKERVNEWLDENFPADDFTDTESSDSKTNTPE